MKKFLLSLFLSVALGRRGSEGSSCQANALAFTVNAQKIVGSMEHYWEGCVGSGHATLALRSDYQKLLSQAHKDCGFQQVRFHGIFDDDMSVYLGPSAGPNEYSFFNVDEVYDYLLSIGMKPYVELSFMPGLLASGNQTVMWYKGNITPPKSWAAWYDLIVQFASHLVDRYGIDEVSTWSFEVWNEPNGLGFWSGGYDGYLQLYNTTASALKSVDKRLRVGGPATMQSGWIPQFLAYTTQYNIPIDFVSTHEYPTDPNCNTYSCMGAITGETRANVTAAKGASFPLYYSEFNDGLGSAPPYHDTSYAAAFLFKNIYDMNGNVDFISWWTFSDIFEEPGQYSSPYGTDVNWGLMNMYGIPKPAYRAFELLHKAGPKLVSVSSPYETVGMWGTTTGKTLSLYAFNTALPGAPITNQTLCVSVAGVSASQATITYIDSSHANPYSAWVSQGSPQYPSPAQNTAQLLASLTLAEALVPTSTNTFQFVLEPQAVAYIEIPL